MRLTRSIVIASALVAAPLIQSLAQSAPRVAMSFEGGAGDHTSRSGEDYFRSNFNGLALVTVSARILQSSRLAMVARYENVLHTEFTYTSDCPQAPNGSCLVHFREADGQGGALGIAVRPVRGISPSLFFGRHWDGPRQKDFVEARLTVSPWRFVAGTIALRHLAWDDLEYGRLWHRPLLFGAEARLP